MHSARGARGCVACCDECGALGVVLQRAGRSSVLQSPCVARPRSLLACTPMACQTGIRADNHLLKFFSECKAGKVRLAKIVVRNEQLCVNFQDAGSGDWRADFRKCLPGCVDAFEPCFVLFRLDSNASWLLISFADDCAPVREKMILAATRATFKAEFGQSNIKYEYNVTNSKEMTVEAFERWLNAREEPAPLSEIERELENASREQKTAATAASQSPHTLKGVVFPIDGEAEEQLRRLAAGQVNYVQLSVDTLNEAIKLERSEAQLSPDSLTRVIPRDKPRYHFYRFSHSYNDKQYNPIIFIYSMPSSGCTIKERMLYSSCKQPFLQSTLSVANIEPEKKIEMDSRDVLSMEALVEHLHPPYDIRPKGFAKPPGPPQRGARRVTNAAV